MAVKLISAREAAQLQGIKLLVHGAAGSGKTRLCATTGGNPVIISAEAGLLSLRELELPVITVQSLQDVHDAYAFLMTEEGQRFDWVCLDSVSEIAEVVLSFEKKQTKDPRRAYGETQDQMMDLLRAFRDLPGRNIYMSAKMERIKDEGAGTTLYAPMMPGNKLGQNVPYIFDLVFAYRVEKDEEGNVQRWLQTGRDFQYEAKDRSGALEMFEPPDLAAIAAKVRGTTETPTQPSTEEEAA